MKSKLLLGMLLASVLSLSAHGDENQIRVGGGPATG